MKRLLIALMILSVFIIGCKVEPAVEQSGGAISEEGITAAQSSEEAEISSTLDEIEELEALDEEFDINLDELDNLSIE